MNKVLENIKILKSNCNAVIISQDLFDYLERAMPKIFKIKNKKVYLFGLILFVDKNYWYDMYSLHNFWGKF